MKRRTNRTGTINGEHHRAAFHYAHRVLGKSVRKSYNSRYKKNGILVRFDVDLEREDGSTIAACFSCTRGFRCDIKHNIGIAWDQALPSNPNRIRCHKGRLRAYREKLHSWNSTKANPLSFRSFNLLLAALSYDVALTQGPTSSTV